jgi:hypothetical protein
MSTRLPNLRSALTCPACPGLPWGVPWICVICGLFVFLLLPISASAHVGSPDFYYEGYAGPYHLLVTVRPPAVIPGIAEIQIRSISTPPTHVDVLPLRLVGQGATLAPAPDPAEHSASDPQLFTGKLWIMSRGSWKVQINAEGPQGKGELAVPIAALSTTSARMQKSLGALLAALGMLLLVGLVGIIGAANRDATLQPGNEPLPEEQRRGRTISVVAAIFLVIVVGLGNFWWKADASETAKLSYKLPHLQLSLQPGNVLQFALENPNDVSWRQYPSDLKDPDQVRLDDLIPDHGHILHLFLVRMPDMTSFWHLHPQQTQTGAANFSEHLPSLPAGHYQVFADIVHRTGFPETQVGELDIAVAQPQEVLYPKTVAETDPCNSPFNQKSEINNQQLNCDDSGSANLPASETISQLSDGYRMVWERDSTPLKTNQATWFRFHIEDKDGKPATDLDPYMDMAGHAVFIRSDAQVFAHVHPAGSVSMAAVELADGGNPSASSMPSMPGMSPTGSEAGASPWRSEGPPWRITFPYGFPKPGDYHIFVQIKRAGKIETGSFLARVKQ